MLELVVVDLIIVVDGEKINDVNDLFCLLKKKKKRLSNEGKEVESIILNLMEV